MIRTRDGRSCLVLEVSQVRGLLQQGGQVHLLAEGGWVYSLKMREARRVAEELIRTLRGEPGHPGEVEVEALSERGPRWR